MGLVGLAVFTFIGYKQTKKHPDKQISEFMEVKSRPISCDRGDDHKWRLHAKFHPFISIFNTKRKDAAYGGKGGTRNIGGTSTPPPGKLGGSPLAWKN